MQNDIFYDIFICARQKVTFHTKWTSSSESDRLQLRGDKGSSRATVEAESLQSPLQHQNTNECGLDLLNRTDINTAAAVA